MKGLRIQDKIRWHDRWSSEIGRRLKVRDSSNDLYIFDEQHGRGDILAVLHEVPEELYQLFEVTEAPEEECEYLTDSGRCYKKTH
jgi:hypothetical protein